MGLVVERVAQVAARPGDGRVEAAQALQAPQRLVVVKVSVESAALVAGLDLSPVGVDCLFGWRSVFGVRVLAGAQVRIMIDSGHLRSRLRP